MVCGSQYNQRYYCKRRTQMIKTNPYKLNWVVIAILIIYWSVCAALYPLLPDQVPAHWNLHFEIDRYSDRAIAALGTPLLPLGIYLLLTLLPRLDPCKENYEKFATSFEIIKLTIVFIPLLIALAYPIKFDLVIKIMLSLLFIILGNHMGKIRYNHFVGIRTPWTLSDEQVWNKTHRFAGKAMVIGSIVSISSVFAPPIIDFIILLSGLLVPLLLSSLYSYQLYKRNK
jgi:uncharacterized membrane protein